MDSSVPPHSNGTRFDLAQCCSRPIDLFETVLGSSGPFERLGCLVVPGEIVVDGRFQFGDAGEGSAADGFPGDLGEETLDLVQPGRRGRREVDMEPRVLFQPLFDLGVLVCGVVVDDQMDIERLGQLAFEPAREGKVLLRRWRFMHWPMTLPSSRFKAANSVVVPLRL